jgi:bifunctional non-homologous end joining protein LigD
MKWDGVRCLAAIEDSGIRLWGRQGANYSGGYPELDVLRRLAVGTVLDGEVVMIRTACRTSTP